MHIAPASAKAASASAWACPGDKAKDDGKQSTPKKPTTSLTIN